MAKNNNLGDFLKGIADKFRSRLGTKDAVNPQSFEDKIDAVYDAAAQKAYDDFWDGFQRNGQRTNYENAFLYWYDIGMGEPKYQVKIGSSYTDRYMFDSNKGIKKLTAAKYDFSEALCSDSNGATGGHCATFYRCSNLTEVEDIGLKPGYYHRTFYDDPKLHTIGMIRSTVNSTFTDDCFYNCTSLRNIRFDGTIGKSINFRHSPLSPDTIHDLLDHLDRKSSAEARTVTVKSSAVDEYNNDEHWGQLDWWNDYAGWLSYSAGWTFVLI